LKSARAFIIFQTLERHGEIIRSEPKVEDIEDEKFDFEFTVVCVTKENEEVFIKDINGIAEVDEVIVVPIDIPELKTQQFRMMTIMSGKMFKQAEKKCMSRKRKVNRILHLRSIKPKPEKLSGLTLTDWMY